MRVFEFLPFQGFSLEGVEKEKGSTPFDDPSASRSLQILKKRSLERVTLHRVQLACESRSKIKKLHLLLTVTFEKIFLFVFFATIQLEITKSWRM